MRDLPKPTGEIFQDIEAALGLRSGFLTSLRNEDDWSFIIKLHALVEAALTHVLADAVPKGDTVKIFSWLPTSDPRTGKLAFAAATGLISKVRRKYVEQLSEMRNAVAHDVRNVDFSFAQFLSSQNSDKQKAIAKAILGPLLQVTPLKRGSSEVQALKGHEKVFIWASGVFVVAGLYAERLKSHTERLANELNRARVAALDAPAPARPGGALDAIYRLLSEGTK